jgi:hypothetical protein
MMFRIEAPGMPLAVELADVVSAIRAAGYDFRWSVAEFEGRGRADVLYGGGLNYREFVATLWEPSEPMCLDDLMMMGRATAETFDLMIIGLRASDCRPSDISAVADANGRFLTLAAQYPFVAECFDSGFWRIHSADETRGEIVRRELAALPNVSIADFDGHSV